MVFPSGGCSKNGTFLSYCNLSFSNLHLSLLRIWLKSPSGFSPILPVLKPTFFLVSSEASDHTSYIYHSRHSVCTNGYALYRPGTLNRNGKGSENDVPT